MRNQIAAAERAGIRAVTINSTNIEDWEPIHDAIARRRGRRAAGQPRAAQQPRLPRRGAAPAGRDLRPAGRRRGALHLRLGPRLPARLPPDPHPARRPARRHPGAGDHRHRQRPGHRRRRRAARHRRPGAARLARPRVAAPRRGPAQDRRSSGWPGWPTTSPSSPAPASSTASPSPPPRRSPTTCAPAATTSRRTPARPTPPSGTALEQDLAAGRVKALVATSALGMGFDATLGFVVNMGAPAVAGRLLPAGRPRRPRHRRGHRRAAARRSRTATSGPTSPRWPSRARSWSGRRSRCSPTEGRPLSTAALETYVELSRTRLETMLKVLDVDGAVRRVRGGWEATGQRVGLRRGALRAGSPRPASASSRRCSTTSTPTGCRMRFLREQLDDPEAADCGRCDNCGGLALVGRRLRRRRVEEAGARLARPGRAWSSRARCGRPRWPTSASTSRARSPTARRGGPRRRPAHRPRPRPGAARPVPAGHARRPGAGAAGPGGDRGARRLAAPTSTAIVVVESATPADPDRRPRRRAVPLLQVPLVGRWAIADPTVAPGPRAR